MKKTLFLAASSAIMLMTSCGTAGLTGNTTNGSQDILGSVIGAATNGETLGNILSSVIGTNKLSKESLYGTWHYDGPGAAFTSNNALAKAGGEIAATKVEQDLAKQYSKLGFSRSNTSITFNSNGTFSAKIDGKRLSGNYTYDEKKGQVRLQTLLLSLPAYVQRNGSGISILFESKKILSLFQTITALSGNSIAQSIGNISKNYDGVRMGFDMKK